METLLEPELVQKLNGCVHGSEYMLISQRKPHGTSDATDDYADTPKSVPPEVEIIKLPKHPQWWLWRGYLTLTNLRGAYSYITTGLKFGDNPEEFNWEYWSSTADELNACLEEHMAFPSHKPDFDLFGIPQRSRKQRGWYHIHRPSCELCSISLPSMSITPILMDNSAVLRIPAEIIHKFVESGNFGRTPVALVCKYWARVCSKQRWQAKLRSHAHITQLRSLVATPGNFLETSITGFPNLYYRLEDDPWVHLLPTTRKLLPQCTSEGDSVEIIGPLRRGLLTMRSIHLYLPRRVPSSFSNSIGYLSLYHIHFRELAHLAQTLGELPQLKMFTGNNLTWSIPEARFTPLPLRRQTHDELPAFISPRVELSECSHNLEAISLILDSRYHCAVLREIVECLISNDPSLSVRAQMKHKICQRSPRSPSSVYQSLYRIKFDLHSEQLRVMRVWCTDIPGISLYVKLSMRLHPERPLSKLTYINWEAYDSAIMKYDQIQSVVIGMFNLQTRGVYRDSDWMPMDEHDLCFIIRMLPRSYAAGKISFAKPRPDEWYLEGCDHGYETI